MIDKVFCTIPWFELHIDANGNYHTCGAQFRGISNNSNSDIYNVHKLSIPQWVNSEYQRTVRLQKLQGVADQLCKACYHEDSLGKTSKRVRENYKSEISHIKFYESFESSPNRYIFEQSSQDGYTNQIKPNSYHISLGNECNLACRMCAPTASSKLAAQEIKAGNYSGPIRMNWTDDHKAWNSVTDYLAATEDLKFVHIIGGEPLINRKFEILIDKLLAANNTDIYIGFTTNGTIFNPYLLEKLLQFRHVDIGISIECMGVLNEYIRQGSNTQEVLNNIEAYSKFIKANQLYVTIRPVPSALSVHTYYELLEWCYHRNLDVFSNTLAKPEFLQIRNLPGDIKKPLLSKYSKWVYSDPAPINSNPRDPNYFKQHIDNEIQGVIAALTQENDPELTKQLYNKLSSWQWLNNKNIEKYFKTNLQV